MRKLCWACGAFAAGAALGELAIPEERRLWAAAFLLLCAGASLSMRGNVRRRAFLAALFAAVGLAWSRGYDRLVAAPAEALAGEERTFSVRVLDNPDVYGDVSSVVVRVTEPGLPAVKCRLNAYGEDWLDELRPGDELRAEARFYSALIRYGEETDSYRSRGIYLRAVCRSEPVFTGRCAGAWRFFPRTLCRRIGELCAACFPSDASALMTALLTGGKSALYEDYSLYYSFSQAGLMHVTAVSGMHVSFLMGFVWLLAPNRRRVLFIGAPLLLFFAALAGFSPSVTRSVFMQFCFLSAPLAKRESDPPTAMALILAVLLALNPAAAAGVSLQMSFAATAGLLLFAPRIQRRLTAAIRARRTLPRKLLYALAAAFAATVSALVFTTPLSALYFGMVSVVAPLTNILCLWVISLLFLGGYLAVGLAALSPAAARPLVWCLTGAARYVRAVTALLSRLPFAAVYTVNPVFVAWLVFVYGLFALAWLLRDRDEGLRPLAPACLAMIGLCAALLGVRLMRTETLRATALDVGQGACTFFECGGTAAVVDCGGGGTARNAGETASYYALSRGWERLDALILTHLHADHANGVTRLLALLPVETLYLPSDTGDPDGVLPELLSAAASAGTDVVWVSDDLTLTDGSLRLTVTAPLGGKEENERGLFVLAEQGDFEVLITGDAGFSQERRFLERLGDRDIEVLIVGHHGSATSTGDRLLEELRPDVAVISVGYNLYGHPTDAVLERLAACGAQVRRTDEEGNITVLAQGGTS